MLRPALDGGPVRRAPFVRSEKRRPLVFSPHTPPTPARSAIMRAVRGKDTKPEMAVRRLVHGMGLRFRLHKSGLPGKPDLVLARHRLAVFVHGCFWHGHDCPRGARVPKTNRAFWTAKIGRNTARDRAVKRGLRAAGWRVLVVWECQLRDMGRVERRLRALTSDGSPDAHGRRDNAPSPSYKTRRTSSPRIGNRE